MLTFIKLGGSLITDKRETQHFQAEVMQRAAKEIASALSADPTMKLLIGHGSGSFGHVAAQKYGTINGVHTPEAWRGFAEVGTVARRLNGLVVDALAAMGLPVIAIQPSSSARCVDGKLVSMNTTAVMAALEHGLLPVIYGDVALDTVRGGTIISTETIFVYLADALCPARIMLLGEVKGVYDTNGSLIPRITPDSLEKVAAALGGSHGTDVTGGMASKVRAMIKLVQRVPGLEIRIFGGTMPGQLRAALLGENSPGTTLCAD
jgi:isopentenyl phosphate kinase